MENTNEIIFLILIFLNMHLGHIMSVDIISIAGLNEKKNKWSFLFFSLVKKNNNKTLKLNSISVKYLNWKNHFICIPVHELQ